MLPKLTKTGKILTNQEVFKGRIFSVSQQEIQTPDG